MGWSGLHSFAFGIVSFLDTVTPATGGSGHGNLGPSNNGVGRWIDHGQIHRSSDTLAALQSDVGKHQVLGSGVFSTQAVRDPYRSMGADR